MELHETYRVINDAKETLANADRQATTLAEMLAGRLRKVNVWDLCKLKRGLHSFNANTRKWKD